mgnify:FL=1
MTAKRYNSRKLSWHVTLNILYAGGLHNMFLAVILYCTTFSDVSTCDVMVRKNHLYQTEQVCKNEIKIVARGLLATGHYVKAKCFSFNPYGEQV